MHDHAHQLGDEDLEVARATLERCARAGAAAILDEVAQPPRTMSEEDLAALEEAEAALQSAWEAIWGADLDEPLDLDRLVDAGVTYTRVRRAVAQRAQEQTHPTQQGQGEEDGQ